MSCDKAGKDSGVEINHTVKLVDFYIVIAADTLITIAIIAVIVWLVWYKRVSALSRNFKISFCLLVLMMIFYDTRNVYMFIHSYSFHQFYDNNDSIPFQIVDVLGQIMLLTFTWFFSSHFLQVACLLKLSLSKHTLLNLETIKRRKRTLLILNIFVYSAISCFIISTLFFYGDLKWYFFVLFTIICLWAVSGVMWFALRHINKYAQMLQAEGIDANKDFVKCYISFSFMMAFCYSMQLVLNTIADNMSDCSPGSVGQKLDFAAQLFFSFYQLPFLCLIILILNMFVKSSQRMAKEECERVTQALQAAIDCE